MRKKNWGQQKERLKNNLKNELIRNQETPEGILRRKLIEGLLWMIY